LFWPDGKEVGPVGEETENFRSMYMKDQPARTRADGSDDKE
jgi:hypothetical protein